MLNNIFGVFRLNPDYRSRVFGLDLMRALAIIFVVIGHGTMLEKADTNFPFIKLIDGVELFFVLSGFLIGGILIKSFLKADEPGLSFLGNFWIRRWFRTLPNYYLVLLLNIVFVYFGIIQEDFNRFNWKFFFFLQNFSQPLYGFFWESWSLTIEEWFYLLFPIILLTIFLPFARRASSARVKKYAFFTAIAIFLLTPLMLRFFKASQFEVDEFWLSVKIYKVVIYRLDGIALGLLAAFIKHYYAGFWSKIKYPAFFAGLIISYWILYSTWIPNAFETKVFKIFYLSFGCFLLLPFFDSLKRAPVLIRNIFTHISLISYSMYLLNLALISEVIRDNFAPRDATTAWLMYAVYWISVIVFSTLLYKYFEKPVMDLRDHYKVSSLLFRKIKYFCKLRVIR